MAIKDRDYRSRALRRNLRKQARKGQLTSREKKELLEQEAAFRDARRARAPIVGGALAALGGALTIPGVQTALGGGMDRLRDFLDKGEVPEDETKPNDETKNAAEEAVADGPNAADAYADRIKLEKARREQELIGGAEDALALAGGIQDIEQEEEQFDDMAPVKARQAPTNQLEERGLQGAGRSIDELVAGPEMDEIRAVGSDERPFDLLSALAGRDLDRAMAALPEGAAPRMTAPEEILSGSGLEELGVRPRLTSPNNPLSRRVEIRDPRFLGEELGLQDIPVGEENFPGDTRDFNAFMDLLPSLERRGRMMPAGAPLRVGGPRVENAMGGTTPSVNKLRDMIKKKYGIR